MFDWALKIKKAKNPKCKPDNCTESALLQQLQKGIIAMD